MLLAWLGEHLRHAHASFRTGWKCGTVVGALIGVVAVPLLLGWMMQTGQLPIHHDELQSYTLRLTNHSSGVDAILWQGLVARATIFRALPYRLLLVPFDAVLVFLVTVRALTEELWGAMHPIPRIVFVKMLSFMNEYVGTLPVMEGILVA